MIISIASGKGGTGKTTVAANLAVALKDLDVQLLDCDVEEPNAHLFLKPDMCSGSEVFAEVPEIDENRCSHCGKCQELCMFNAIAVLPQAVLTFKELCHSCGGCFMVCPENAVMAGRRLLGKVEEGTRGNLHFTHGVLRVGEAMAPPLIRKVRATGNGHQVVIVDAPPGTSCPVIAAIRGSDYVLLVTEPTPFGLNDLELAVGAARCLRLPVGIVINRSDLGDRRIHDFARKENLPVLLEIPFDRHVAEVYARGDLLVEVVPQWHAMMRSLFEKIVSNLREWKQSQ